MNNSWNLIDRKKYLSNLQVSTWDVLIIGGGISGAGTLLSSSFHGFKTLLVEQKDFAWGTSSRSSKMVHGGLRYIAKGNYKLTKESVTERQHLLRKLAGLVDPLSFILPHYKLKWPPAFLFRILVKFYDFLARTSNSQFYSFKDLIKIFPGIRDTNLKSGTNYYDAATTDSRLVMRILLEAKLLAGEAVNYLQVQEIIKIGEYYQVTTFDSVFEEKIILKVKSVINCSGVWGERFGNEISKKYCIRPLRGSHIIIPNTRLLVSSVVLLMHPKDKRPVFIFPYHGTSVIGTTDLDHKTSIDTEPHITEEEIKYLLELGNYYFPNLKLTDKDIISTWSGVRPVISSKKISKKPSSETREHIIWENQDGIISIAGGKLTTFSVIAHELIERVSKKLNEFKNHKIVKDIPYSSWDKTLWKKEWKAILSRQQLLRLEGLYGSYNNTFQQIITTNDLVPIANTKHLFAELKWALLYEAVVHLDDLLLRRTQLGLLLPNGGSELFPYLQQICTKHLKWNSKKWNAELIRYQSIWQKHYSIPV